MVDRADLNMVVGLDKADIQFQAVQEALAVVHCHTKEHLVAGNFDKLVVVLDSLAPVPLVGHTLEYLVVLRIDQADFWVAVDNNLS